MSIFARTYNSCKYKKIPVKALDDDNIFPVEVFPSDNQLEINKIQKLLLSGTYLPPAVDNVIIKRDNIKPIETYSFTNHNAPSTVKTANIIRKKMGLGQLILTGKGVDNCSTINVDEGESFYYHVNDDFDPWIITCTTDCSTITLHKDTIYDYNDLSLAKSCSDNVNQIKEKINELDFQEMMLHDIHQNLTDSMRYDLEHNMKKYNNDIKLHSALFKKSRERLSDIMKNTTSEIYTQTTTIQKKYILNAGVPQVLPSGDILTWHPLHPDSMIIQPSSIGSTHKTTVLTKNIIIDVFDIIPRLKKLIEYKINKNTTFDNEYELNQSIYSLSSDNCLQCLLE
jgi:hypothetical protein